MQPVLGSEPHASPWSDLLVKPLQESSEPPQPARFPPGVGPIKTSMPRGGKPDAPHITVTLIIGMMTQFLQGVTAPHFNTTQVN